MLVKNIELCCRDVIINLTILFQTAALEKEVVSLDEDHANSFWANLRNITLCIAVIRWNNVFGAYSEPTHWHKLPGIDKDLVKLQLLESCQIDSSEWGAAQKAANYLRNQVIAHNQYNNPAPNPVRYLSTLFRSARCIRGIAISCLSGKYTPDTALADYVEQVSRLPNEELEEQVSNMVIQVSVRKSASGLKF